MLSTSTQGCATVGRLNKLNANFKKQLRSKINSAHITELFKSVTKSQRISAKSFMKIAITISLLFQLHIYKKLTSCCQERCLLRKILLDRSTTCCAQYTILQKSYYVIMLQSLISYAAKCLRFLFHHTRFISLFTSCSI